jgi:putative transposase
MEDEHIYKRHNKTLHLHHLVFPLKYRKKCLDEKSGETLKVICIAISERYEIQILEVCY